MTPQADRPGTQSGLRILVVDDNRSSADALARLLRKTGDTVVAEYGGEAAIAHLRRDPPDVVLTDLKMEPVDGMQVLAAARGMHPPVETIVFTAYGAVNVAVRAMHLGARDFLTKPVSFEQVSRRLDEIRVDRGLGAPLAPVAELPAASESAFVAHSDTSRQLFATLERAATVPSAVWIEGEIGSGRTFVARTLHRLTERHVSRTLPFTQRAPDRTGTPWPTEGTVLLPQVDDLSLEDQRELHRELQSVPEGVRIVATAQPDGRRRVAEGQLRPELYYRLAVVVVGVPPLRRRTEDVLPLLDQALAEFSRRYGHPVPVLPPRLRDDLRRHYWPGNLRELLNLAERAVVMGPSGADLEVVEDHGPGMPKLDVGFNLNDYLESVERRILAEALRKSGGDRAAVGRLLGVERNTLRYKLNKYGLLDR